MNTPMTYLPPKDNCILPVAKKRKKEEGVFLFPFSKNKVGKEDSEQARTVLVSFYLNCSWFRMSVTKFAFLPPNSAAVTVYILSFASVLDTPPPWCLPLHLSPYSHRSERMPQSHLTARLNYWITDESLWLSLRQWKWKKSRSCHLCSSALTPD